MILLTMLYLFVFMGAMLMLTGPVLFILMFYFMYKEEKDFFNNMKDELKNG